MDNGEMRGADLLVAALARAGVTRIFALSGNQIMPVFDACLDAGIAITHTRHEAAAVFMAEAHAQLTGRPGVAMVTAGAGAGNTPGALFAALATETPVLLLSGDSPRAQDGRGAFQEMDQVAMLSPVTRWSHRVRAAADLGRDAARALQVAQASRPGPVHLALPADLLNKTVTAADLPDAAAFQPDFAAPDPHEVRQVADALRAAQRPVILTGPSLAPARHPELVAGLADATGTPVLNMQSPRGLNDPAYGDLGAVLARADLVCLLGKTIDFTLQFGDVAPQARWIAIDAEAAVLSRARAALGGRMVLACQTHPPAMIAALGAASGNGTGTASDARADWQAEVAALQAARPDIAAPTDDTITSATLCAEVEALIARHPGTIMICDGGEFGQWAQAIRGTDRVIVNGIGGAIGAGPAQAIGARQACPEAPVIALMGDGAAGFHLSEFETAAREATPFVAVIGNDRRWNAEHQIQIRNYGPERTYGCDLSGARYDLAAEALGARGFHVTRAADLEKVLQEAMTCGTPACVNVEIEGLPARAGPAH